MRYYILIGLIMLGVTLPAQEITLGLDQPEQLTAMPGADTLLCKTHSVTLGGDPTAAGGSGTYYYLWYPDVYLDNSTSANPVCTPEETTTYMLTVTDENGCTVTGFITVGVDPCLSSGGLLLSENLKIYPNPAYDFLRISGTGLTGSIRVKLFNHIGQQKQHELVEAAYPGQELQISLHPDLEPGMYFVHLESIDQKVIRPIYILQ